MKKKTKEVFNDAFINVPGIRNMQIIDDQGQDTDQPQGQDPADQGGSQPADTNTDPGEGADGGQPQGQDPADQGGSQPADTNTDPGEGADGGQPQDPADQSGSQPGTTATADDDNITDEGIVIPKSFIQVSRVVQSQQQKGGRDMNNIMKQYDLNFFDNVRNLAYNALSGSSVDPALVFFIYDLLENNADLRRKVTKHLADLEAQRPKYYWRYKGIKGEVEDQIFNSREAAEAAAKAALDFGVPFKDLFVKDLYRIDEEGNKTDEKVPKVERDEYLKAAGKAPAATRRGKKGD